MTRALVVFESMYGNNQQLAAAIADGVRSAGGLAEVLEVSDAPRALPADVSLLLVGAPNHATGLPHQSGRTSAAKETDQPLVSSGIGLREWFDQLEKPPHAVSAAGWDTRLTKPRFLRFLDRASRGIEQRLRRRGLRIVVRAEHFYVTGTTGPLADGELDRARQWGTALASYVTTSEPARSER
ncbi:MAG: flavodoxin domain-containing protein [Chloroflexi bacterium]|nr:flavodoxin domain-containing protein [Chloroflexota bacterium]MDA1146618.1 flavodoxin domain-containing protein [Chloroflexota bacterium]MQC82837.1 flavodoxin [Chloroflexota bacterium]